MWVCSVGAVYNKMGQNEKALEYYDKSLKIKIRVLGQDHLPVADTKHKCACCCCPRRWMVVVPVSL